MGKRSAEYYQGFNSKKNLNPFAPGTEEFNQFERGWLQRLKQGLPIDETNSTRANIDHLTYAMNINKPTSMVITKKATLDELCSMYGHPKRR